MHDGMVVPEGFRQPSGLDIDRAVGGEPRSGPPPVDRSRGIARAGVAFEEGVREDIARPPRSIHAGRAGQPRHQPDRGGLDGEVTVQAGRIGRRDERRQVLAELAPVPVDARDDGRRLLWGDAPGGALHPKTALGRGIGQLTRFRRRHSQGLVRHGAHARIRSDAMGGSSRATRVRTSAGTLLLRNARR